MSSAEPSEVIEQASGMSITQNTMGGTGGFLYTWFALAIEGVQTIVEFPLLPVVSFVDVAEATVTTFFIDPPTNSCASAPP